VIREGEEDREKRLGVAAAGNGEAFGEDEGETHEEGQGNRSGVVE